MFRRYSVKSFLNRRSLSVLIAASLIGVGLLNMSQVYGGQLPNRSLTLSSATPGATAAYNSTFTIPATQTLTSIKLEICAESPLLGAPCSAPNGFSMANATLGAQSGVSGFSLANSTSNSVTLNRTSATVSAGQVIGLQFNNIGNPTLPGSYFGRLQTYSAANASGAPTDSGGLAFSINSTVSVTVTVPPYLYFCVGITVANTDCATAKGNYIDFGNFSPAIASAATSQMVAGTNADTGYSITANGNTLTSGNNIIPALTTANVSRPGVSQFGMNLVANQDPQVGKAPAGSGAAQPVNGYGQANRYKFVSGDIVVQTPLPDAPRNYTTSYLTNVAKNQSAGIYATTVTYICTATF